MIYNYDSFLENVSRTDYLKWKRKNVTLRGIKDIYSHSGVNGGGSYLGEGLYTAPLSNKSLAKEYGTVRFVVNAKPKNPLKFKDLNRWEIWYQTLCINYAKKHGNDDEYRSISFFEKNTSISKEILELGYDGVEIIGREYVNYTPSDVLYFTNERQLENYYYNNFS